MPRSRLQATVDSLARKRQHTFDEQSKWNTQTQYYKNWERNNNQYQSWTSPEYYSTSLNQYDTMKKKEKKEENLRLRREKLRKLFFEEEQNYDLETKISPRHINHRKMNETPIEVLKDVNIGLKLAEDDRRRNEAQINLYHQWRQENPIVRDYEAKQRQGGLKLAWLDQQIEKRMQQEKTEEETRKLIEKRNRLIKEEEILDRQELEEHAKKEKDYMSQIELQIQQFKIKDEQVELLKQEEAKTITKKLEIEDLLQKQADEIKQRKEKEIALYNIHQSKMKLRKKALEIEDQLRNDRKIIEEILESQTTEQIENEQKRNQLKNSITSFLHYVREQQQLEAQRKKYISFIFDSEAKVMWEKQDRIWVEEQQARDKLLTDVLAGISEQIQEKLSRNIQQQRELLKEREEMLEQIEEHDKEMRAAKDEYVKNKQERKLDLDKQVKDKKLIEKEKKMAEEKKKLAELEKIRLEEERIKYELLRMQRRQYPQARTNRRILW